MPKKKPKTYWAGFVAGKIHEEVIPDSYGDCIAPSVFKHRSKARMRYQDVRRVKIVEISKPKRGAKK